MRKIFSFINDRTPLFLVTPHDRTIGNTAEEIYFSFLYARRFNKKVILLRRLSLFGIPQISNREAFRLRSPQSFPFCYGFFQFIGNLVVTVFFGIIPATILYWKLNFSRLCKLVPELISFCLHPRGRSRPRVGYHYFRSQFNYVGIGTERIWNRRQLDHFSWADADSTDWKKELGEFLPVAMSGPAVSLCKEQTVQMGLPADAWYICLHVREGGFYGDKTAARNSDIMKSLKMIQAITQLGGWVIRMGDRSMRPLPKMEKVIDYPFTEFKSEAMDLHLIQNCKFYMGSNSGILDCALLFQKRFIVINDCEWSLAFPARKNSLAIMKHVFSKRLNRFLSIQELLQEPFSWQDLHIFGKDYVFVENTPDEILEVATEMLSQDQDPVYSYSSKQEEFILRRKKQIVDWFSHGLLWETQEADVFGKYRISSRATCSEGTLGRAFLEKNWSHNHLNDLKDQKPL